MGRGGPLVIGSGNVSKQVIEEAVRDATSLAFLRTHNWFTRGRCWLSEQAGMRRALRPICVRSCLEFMSIYTKGMNQRPFVDASRMCRLDGWFGMDCGWVYPGSFVPDTFTSRRLNRVALEGGHQVTLFAAFAKDLMSSPLGGVVWQ